MKGRENPVPLMLVKIQWQKFAKNTTGSAASRFRVNASADSSGMPAAKKSARKVHRFITSRNVLPSLVARSMLALANRLPFARIRTSAISIANTHF